MIFSQKTSKKRVERLFQEVLPFDTLSTKNLLRSRKKPSVFPNKTQFSNVLRNFTISVALYGIYATVCSKNFTFRKVNEHRLTCVNAIDKHCVKNTPI